MVREQVEASKNELMPRFMIFTGQNEMVMVMAQFGEEKEKDATADLVRSLVKTHDAACVVMVSESWTVEGNNAKMYEAGRKLGHWSQVADCPWRQECVMFLVETKTGHQIGRGMISKKADGKRTFGDVKIIEGRGMTGRFTNFIADKQQAQ